ncbi:peroxidase 41-like [Euphorbia lathyris]|uniref:peroxidase 41-like n=1 Tax=Euphorbia lathyris TaxID=212925 RepID=UPI00331430C8
MKMKMKMASFAFPLILLITFLSIPAFSRKSEKPKLKLDYYKTTCPDFAEIVRDVVTSKQSAQPTTAAATLRVFFHDCMVEGCDASVLISSNSFNKAERDHHSNANLPGDAFDVILKAKTSLELQCPKVVSCADILAQLTRDLIVMVGGPFFPVLLGRKDGLISEAARVEGNLPSVNFTMDQSIEYFKTRGFDTKEMVALLGAHTIGFAHCREFADRLYHYSEKVPTDPEYNPKFADALKTLCKNYSKDAAMSAFNDVLTPGKFDNMYYQNLPRGLGVLKTDHGLVKDPRTKPFVMNYAANQTLFFQDFSAVMEKLGSYHVKTGEQGEIRARCDQFNSILT